MIRVQYMESIRTVPKPKTLRDLKIAMSKTFKLDSCVGMNVLCKLCPVGHFILPIQTDDHLETVLEIDSALLYLEHTRTSIAILLMYKVIGWISCLKVFPSLRVVLLLYLLDLSFVLEPRTAHLALVALGGDRNISLKNG